MDIYTQSLQSALAASGVTGASFAYWDGERLHAAIAGLRNSITGDPITLDTVMHIGSITKIFNTVLFMQLVDEHLIELDDPVVRYLPELRLRDMDALQKITCKMLVNHTSGINCEMLEDHGPDQERIVDAIARCADMEQLHPPGKGPSYSNIGTVIAGYLIQKIRGKSWYTLVKERLFAPLEMRNALADLADLPRFRQSIGDETEAATGKLVQSSRAFLAPSFAPCGTTLMMSASDLMIFIRTLLNGGIAPTGERIISAESAALMAQPSVRMLFPPGRSYGLGWGIWDCGVLSHSGGGPGIVSQVYAHPQSGRAVALLTNCDRGAELHPAMLDPILRSWIGTWNGTAANRPVHRNGVVDAERYIGIYRGGNIQFEIFSENGTLAMRQTFTRWLHDNTPKESLPPVRLFPQGDEVFEGAAPAGSSIEMKFMEPDSHGRMQALVFGARIRIRIK